MKIVSLIWIVLVWANGLFAQTFTNGGLEGTIGYSAAPAGWQMIPYTDPISSAYQILGYDSPDIIGVSGPSIYDNVGEPYEGSTFLSGLFLTFNSGTIVYTWHEGVMQKISGLIPGKQYALSFHQTVDYQGDCRDQTGGWKVYADSNLIGTSAISNGSSYPFAYFDTTQVWDLRTVTFVATDTFHTIKFIPYDDDNDQEGSTTNINGGLRMGLDDVKFTCVMPTPSFGNDTAFCAGNSVVLDAKNIGSNFLWQDGSTDSIFTAKNTGLYWVQIDNGGACKLYDSINVTSNSLPIANFSDSLKGCVPLSASFTDSSQNNITNWLWDFGDGNTSTQQNPSTVYQNDGVFDVNLIVTDNNGCSDTLLKPNYIEAYPNPIADFSYETDGVIYVNSDIEFLDESAGNPIIWNWSFGDNDTEDIQNPLHAYSNTGIYSVTLTVENNYGCSSTITKNLEVKSPYSIYVPNAFTPDGDNNNATFFAVGYGIGEFEMQVFNRWGELLFTSDDIQAGWDGTYQNEEVQNGVYIWKIFLKEEHTEINHRLMGHVNLIK